MLCEAPLSQRGLQRMTAHQTLTAADLDRIAAQLVAALDSHLTRPTQDEKGFILKLAAERLRRNQRIAR